MAAEMMEHYARIKNLLLCGWPVKAIAAQIGCEESLVRAVRRELQAQGAGAR